MRCRSAYMTYSRRIRLKMKFWQLLRPVYGVLRVDSPFVVWAVLHGVCHPQRRLFASTWAGCRVAFRIEGWPRIGLMFDAHSRSRAWQDAYVMETRFYFQCDLTELNIEFHGWFLSLGVTFLLHDHSSVQHRKHLPDARFCVHPAYPQSLQCSSIESV